MADANPLTSNWEQADTYGYGVLGSTVTEASGIFSFPNTGIWRVDWHCNADGGASAGNSMQLYIGVTTDASSGATYNTVTQTETLRAQHNYATYQDAGPISTIIDCTDVAEVKVRFGAYVTNGNVRGSTSVNFSSVIFTQLGDT